MWLLQCEIWCCCLCVGWIARPRPQLWFTRSSVVTCGPVVSISSVGLGLGSKTLQKNGLACLTHPELQSVSPAVLVGHDPCCGSGESH